MARHGRCTAALFGTLYYQADLRARVSAADSTNDAALVLACYRRWGEDAIARLEGEFALVIHDPTRTGLLLARDPLGGYPLYWSVQDGLINAGSSQTDLLRALPRVELNLDYCAECLAQGDQSNEPAGEATPYLGLHRVQSGTIVHIELKIGRTQVRRFWDWQERLNRPASRHLPDIAPQYRELLRAAVRERMSGMTVAHLSGGMDSTAVALLAQDSRLRTISVVYDRLPKLARERPFIEQAIAAMGGHVAHRLQGDDWLDFGSFANPSALEEPYPALWRMPFDAAMMTAARELGADTVLTGIGADELLDPKPYHLADRLRRGDYLGAWREAGQWALAHRCNVWEIFSPFALAPLRWTSWMADSQSTIPPWILPEFANSHHIKERMLAAGRRRYSRAKKTTLSVAISSLLDRSGDVLRWSLATPHGINFAHPFQDLRVLALGLGVLDQIEPQPGHTKPLLSLALADLMPPGIAQRRRKGHFDELFYLGLARHLPQLLAMLTVTPAQQLGILDPRRLAVAVEEASLGGASARSLQPMVLALCLCHWLCGYRQHHTEALGTNILVVSPTGDPICPPTGRSSPNA